MYGKLQAELKTKLAQIKTDGLYKAERVIESPQAAHITVNGRRVLNFCANNYLGLANDERLRRAAQNALDKWGYGLSSVRFICGTQTIHKELESKLAQFLGTDDSILFSSCFDANGAVFEPLLDENCAIITDALNHASIIDGVRLCKAQRWVFKHADMSDSETIDTHTGKPAKGLERCLKEAQNCRLRMIVTDGVFSMDGDIADLQTICTLAEKYDALVLVDDSHATGFVGAGGRGTAEYCGVQGRVDIITTTFGKALGGASGGAISGRAEIIEYLRQRARPYLFSNSLAPSLTAATLECIKILTNSNNLLRQLEENTQHFRKAMTELGFAIKAGVHPITPVMLYDEKLAHAMADALLQEGIYVIGFSYPVVPRGQARIRTQISAAHSKEDIATAVAAFAKVGKHLGVIK